MPTPEFLSLYGLDAGTYGPYEVATQHNIAETVRMSGIDFSYKQALTFLPRWARGVYVFANGSAQRPVGGNATANFQGYLPSKASWGYSLVREKFNFRMNWSYQSKNRLGSRSGSSIEPGVYEWMSSRVFSTSSASSLTKRSGLTSPCATSATRPSRTRSRGPTRRFTRSSAAANRPARCGRSVKGTF